MTALGYVYTLGKQTSRSPNFYYLATIAYLMSIFSNIYVCSLMSYLSGIYIQYAISLKLCLSAVEGGCFSERQLQ